MAIRFDPNSSQIPKLVLNPIPISVAPPRSPPVQPSVKQFESSDTKKGNKRRSKEDSPSVSSENKRPDFLPQGWEIKEFTRKGGKMAGSKYKYYIEPGTNQVFRSLLEVRRHLGVCDTPKKPRTDHNKINGCTEIEHACEAAINGKKEEKMKAEEDI